jgi:predicted DsbA family dithiol-disulfide isomerase
MFQRFALGLLLFVGLSSHLSAQHVETTTNTTMTDTIHIEIWSDVMCPFCYLGKRKFDEALQQFEHNSKVKIEWKSFQLNPELVTDTSMSVIDYLLNVKNISHEQATQMNAYIGKSGKAVGIDYHFDNVVLYNTMLAHRLLHYAKSIGQQHEAEERFFLAHFTEGKNLDDAQTLLEIAEEMKWDKNAVQHVIDTDEYTHEVRMDMYEAQQLGISGVPFFLFNEKLAVSGAQDTSVFLDALRQSIP